MKRPVVLLASRYSGFRVSGELTGCKELIFREQRQIGVSNITFRPRQHINVRPPPQLHRHGLNVVAFISIWRRVWAPKVQHGVILPVGIGAIQKRPNLLIYFPDALAHILAKGQRTRDTYQPQPSHFPSRALPTQEVHPAGSG